MRQYVKKQIIELLGTLNGAHLYIAKCGEDERKDILTQCQEGAMKVGSTIEQSEGEDSTAVHLLENYCEEVFEVSCNPGDEFKLRKKIGKLSARITQAMEEIEQLPTQKVALFFPYKASMWDSLESVWMAAREDPDCETMVIPIPYYDKNPDGSFGEMHYEGSEFPDYVPVADWRTIDIEKTHPELIFIHNPYDEFNYVTSVHPDFYASKLHGYTDCLVYIPYFVVNGDIPEHMCFTSGSFFADKVIVKDEKEKQIYLKVFRDYARENNCAEAMGDYENKFLPLGNPKFDRAMNMKRDDAEIPEEWKKLIYTEDGNRKKVIFFNNSIGTFLNDKEKYLDKIEDTFKVFRERDDVVLLWRPHPLLPATIKSMAPEMQDRYRMIVDGYKKEGWGIYDDTPDMDRSIAISDAYYGDDSSSVIALYKATGKPVMAWDLNVRNA